MITELLLEIINQFSLRTLYFEMAWFATFGYLMHVFVVMGLTRLPFFTLVQAIFRLQVSAILTSFAIAPILGGVSIQLAKVLSFGNYAMYFAGQQVYVWFTVSMMFVASYVLCQVFVTVPCQRFRFALAVTNAGVGILGLFVIKALNLLILL